MSLATSNRDGGRTSESGHLRALLKGLAGEILTGLAVSQRGAGANMSVDVAIGDAMIPRSDATYGHPAWNDAVYNQAIAAADVSNPRRDIVVMYIDYATTPSTGVSNNTNGVVKIKVVAGTPAGSPADPTDSAIQSSVGSGNPYVKLARVRVGAGASSITNSVIDDMRTMAQAIDNGGWNPLSVAWDAWAYASWDSTRKYGVLTVADSSIFTVGQKVRFWQLTGGWKYGFIMAKPSGTQIGVYMGNNYTLNNERVYLPAYSRDSAPDGFDKTPATWLLRSILATTTATTGNNTVQTPGNLLLQLCPGGWRARSTLKFQKNTSTLDLYTGLSDSNTAFSPAHLRDRHYDANGATNLEGVYFENDFYNASSNITLYAIFLSVSGGYDARGTSSDQPSYIEAVPVYLYG